MNTQLQKVAKNTKKEYNEEILEMYNKTTITLLLNLKKYLENCNLLIGECYRRNDANLEKLY